MLTDARQRGYAGLLPGADVPRRLFLLGCPRSRTTVAQTVISQACALVTMWTNWWLASSGTRLLNGPEGEPREVTRPFAQRRVTARLTEMGLTLPEGFRVEEALDRLAIKVGAVGWLEKTPLHVLALDEIVGFDLPNLKLRVSGCARVVGQDRANVYALRFEGLPEPMTRCLHALAVNAPPDR